MSAAAESDRPWRTSADTRRNRRRGWHVHEDTDGPVHVWPQRDDVPHDVDGLDCLCGPDVDWSDPDTGAVYDVPMVTHHSLDGREQQEVQ